MGQDNAELIAEAREHIDAEIGHGYKSDWDAAQTNPLIARLADALERVTPRVVTEVAELDALPLESVIRWDNGVEYVSAERGYGVWMVAGSDNNLDSNEVTLPATVLFTPTGKENEHGN